MPEINGINGVQSKNQPQKSVFEQKRPDKMPDSIFDTKTYTDPETNVGYVLTQTNEQKKKHEYTVFGDNGSSYTYDIGSDKGFNEKVIEGTQAASVSIGLNSDYKESKNIFENLVKPAYTHIDPKKPMTKEQQEEYSKVTLSQYR